MSDIEEQEDSIFGKVIHSYSRAQALEDGELIDVTETAREAGFTVPVAVTRAVWEDCIAWSKENTELQVYQDQSGRLWDVVWMAAMAAKRTRGGQDRLTYKMLRVKRDGLVHPAGFKPPKPTVKATTVELIMHSGPGDRGEHVITIMYPGDD